MSYSIKYFNYRWQEITAEEALDCDHYVSLGDNLKSVYLVVGGKVNKVIQKASYCKEVHIPVLEDSKCVWEEGHFTALPRPQFGMKIIDL